MSIKTLVTDLMNELEESLNTTAKKQFQNLLIKKRVSKRNLTCLLACLDPQNEKTKLFCKNACILHIPKNLKAVIGEFVKENKPIVKQVEIELAKLPETQDEIEILPSENIKEDEENIDIVEDDVSSMEPEGDEFEDFDEIEEITAIVMDVLKEVKAARDDERQVRAEFKEFEDGVNNNFIKVIDFITGALDLSKEQHEVIKNVLDGGPDKNILKGEINRMKDVVDMMQDKEITAKIATVSDPDKSAPINKYAHIFRK